MSETNQDDDYKPETIPEMVERIRRKPPRPGEDRKTLQQLAEDQGTAPMDWEWFHANKPRRSTKVSKRISGGCGADGGRLGRAK